MGSHGFLLLMAMAKAFFFVAVAVAVAVAEDDINGWLKGSATFYGDMGGGETMQGACGYGNLTRQGYGLETTALSEALFNNGATCGACYEVMCTNDPQWCRPGSVKVTATNFCPPNYTKPTDIWCNPPQKHFDLSMPMFVKLANYKAGIIPIFFRRIPCIKTGGLKFELKGNPWWLMVLVYNVGGAGVVKGMEVKGSKTGWMVMSRNWGQNWQVLAAMARQGLSFRVSSSDGRKLQCDNVVPPNWQIGQNYEAKGKQF